MQKREINICTGGFDFAASVAFRRQPDHPATYPFKRRASVCLMTMCVIIVDLVGFWLMWVIRTALDMPPPSCRCGTQLTALDKYARS